jgi:hypothetical protein
MPFRPFQTLLAAAIVALTLGSAAHAMSFETITPANGCAERVCVLASGEIDHQSARQFTAFVRAHKIGRGALVVLNSDGGALMESLQLGEEIREAGFSTAVEGFDRKSGRMVGGGACASACAYVFLGGVERSVGRGSRIGVHQVYTAGQTWAMSAADGMELMSLVAEHVNKLCGDVRLLIPALKTRPEDMYWLSASELTRYAVITTPVAAS